MSDSDGIPGAVPGASGGTDGAASGQVPEAAATAGSATPGNAMPGQEPVTAAAAQAARARAAAPPGAVVQAAPYPYPAAHAWRPPGGAPPPPGWYEKARSGPPAPVSGATLVAVVVTGLLSGLLLGDGIGVNLLLVAVPAALAAYFAARGAGRRARPWTLLWALGGLALLVVPALRDAAWPSVLAVLTAIGVGALALHGGRGWAAVLLAPVGLAEAVVPGTTWAWTGLRARAGSQGRVGPVLRTSAVALALVVVFGALFAGADAAFADLVGTLVPDVSMAESPLRVLLALLGLLGAVAAARTAAAPLRWDRVVAKPGRARSRLEWALPLIVLNLLFAAFNAVQLTVLFGGYDKVLSETGLTYAEYARQGFWQLLTATLLTLAVIALALRWAPRSDARDRTLVRTVLGVLCALTLVVVASALRRMDLYVDAYGLTRLRISVTVMELWLGLVLVLIMAAGAFGARWLPRAVAASAAVTVLAFGLASPDALVAESNVRRFQETGKIDTDYLDGLSADAVPALDALPEPQRSCALRQIAVDLRGDGGPWYATSWGQARARDVIATRAVAPRDCVTGPRDPYENPYGDPYGGTGRTAEPDGGPATEGELDP
ncbi:DUF4173 domain-containing protein [Streptomyces sp. NPDC001941]|uniref:DUF4153 domain-containing protein n=1 Tax=Streptomyces sp. NPDC001941 TaxID=3154659 RepID=UPI003332E257